MLPDLVNHHLALLICGNAVGSRSAEQGQYYAGTGNRFWATLQATGLTTELLTAREYSRILEFGIGLTDLIKDQAGNDRAVRPSEKDRRRLRALVRRCRPALVAFNGKRAARSYFGHAVGYGLQADAIQGVPTFVAPSTSAVAGRYWKLSLWEELAGLVRRASGKKGIAWP
jgi:double-stranded uracil-DNA glycosylase